LGVKVNPEDPKVRASLLEIRRQNDAMTEIINDFLDFNRIEDKNFVLFPSVFSLKRVIEEVVGAKSMEANRAGLIIYVNVSDDLPDILADRIKIKSVVSHLLDNAIRYSNKKGKINITAQKEEKDVRFSITDEGIGISSKDAKNVFKKFFHKGGRTGIGLFMAKNIVEKSGGKIDFETIEEKGSMFWFTLPIK
jgi:signal transduction histidine kinase